MTFGCSACGTNGAENNTQPLQNANRVADSEALEESSIKNDAQPEETVQTTERVEQDSSISEVEQIYTALQKGDFSYFVGAYEPCGVYHDYYGGGEQLPNLVLQDNGIVLGGLVYGSYPETKPISVTLNENGSYLCQVRYSSDANQDYFVIYPQGVIGENPYIYNDPFLTDTAYIHYFSIDGGVSDIIYYKIAD